MLWFNCADFGSLSACYFDRTEFIDNQIKAFVNEFETKRGDNDLRFGRIL